MASYGGGRQPGGNIPTLGTGRYRVTRLHIEIEIIIIILIGRKLVIGYSIKREYYIYGNK